MLPTFGYEFVALFNKFDVTPPLKHLVFATSSDATKPPTTEFGPIFCAINYNDTYMSDMVIVAPVPTALQESQTDGPAIVVSEFLLRV